MHYKFKRKFEPEPGLEPRTSKTPGLALYHLSSPGSIDGTGLNSLICQHLTCELTSLRSYFAGQMMADGVTDHKAFHGIAFRREI